MQREATTRKLASARASQAAIAAAIFNFICIFIFKSKFRFIYIYNVSDSNYTEYQVHIDHNLEPVCTGVHWFEAVVEQAGYDCPEPDAWPTGARRVEAYEVSPECRRGWKAGLCRLAK